MSVQALSCAMAVRGVSPSEKLLLLALANYADEQMRCWPSQRRLAEDTCLTDRTVRSLLAGLEERRLLSREERTRADGSRSTDIITLHFSGEVRTAQISGGAEIISGGGEVASGGTETASGLTTFDPSLEPIPEANASGELASKDPDAKAWDEAVGVLVGQGGLSAPKARAFFGGLLKAHGLEPRDMLAPLAEAFRLGTRDPQGYLKAAAMARQRRHAGPAKMVGFV